MKKYLCMLLLITLLVGCAPKQSITKQEAKEQAMALVQGEFLDVNQTKEDGKNVYVVRLIKDGTLHTLVIDFSGRVIEHDQDALNFKDTDQQLISLKEAEQIAIGRVGGGVIKSIELNKDADETTHYDIDVSFENKNYEISVNAITGDILKFEQD